MSAQRPDEAKPGVPGLPRAALRWPDEVAASLGVSANTLRRHDFLSEVRAIRLGAKVVLVPVAELERWAEEHARDVLDADRMHGRRARNGRGGRP
jgi:hypothetical protein